MNKFYTLSRLPIEYFLTCGSGESDYGKGELGDAASEAGSYDAALREANIHNYNIIKYTSLVPKKAKKISIKKGKSQLKWGSVLECILSQKNGKKGEKITAGLLITDITSPTGNHLGSFACEYQGSDSIKIAKEVLLADLSQMVERRGYGKIKLRLKTDIITKKKSMKTEKGYTCNPRHFLAKSLKVKKNFGTVITALCYTKFEWEEC